MKIKKAVIPVAGFGTRFLPITKTIPKEMLPIVDKPIVQIIVEELVEAGIKEIVLVINGYKKPLEDYFFPHFELETLLEKSGKTEQLKMIKRLNDLAQISFVRQKSMGGTGDAILTAAPAVGNEPFIVFWGDDFIVAQPSRARQLCAAFAKYQACILGGIHTTNPEDGQKYGFAQGEEVEKGLIKIDQLIEKPGFSKMPSSLATVSGFVFTPAIFAALKSARKKIPSGRELYYVDGLNVLKKKEPIYALELKEAYYYDTGNKLEYLKAVVDFALKNKEFGQELKKYLKVKLAERG